MHVCIYVYAKSLRGGNPADTVAFGEGMNVCMYVRMYICMCLATYQGSQRSVLLCLGRPCSSGCLGSGCCPLALGWLGFLLLSGCGVLGFWLRVRPLLSRNGRPRPLIHEPMEQDPGCKVLPDWSKPETILVCHLDSLYVVCHNWPPPTGQSSSDNRVR